MNKTILRLAIPNIISGITVPLLGAIDLAMMGRLNNILFLGAISIGSMIFNFIYWAIGVLRMGVSGFTSQAFGKEDKRESISILARGIAISLLIAFVLLVLQKPVYKFAIAIIKPEASLIPIISSYFKIRILAAPATISSFIFAGWFIGNQDTKTPMWIAICINILNIIFNCVFIFILNMDINGVALGTVIAQYGGALISIFVILKKYNHFLPLFQWSCLKDTKSLITFLSINKDIFIRTLLIILVFSFFTAESAKYGNKILVVNTILYQFFIFFSYGIDGFAHAAEALTGRFIGSNDPKSKSKAIKTIFQWSIFTCVLVVLIYAFAYNPILRIFTTDIDVITTAQSYYYWVLLIVVTGMPAFILDGVYAGSLETKAMLIIMFISAIIFFAIYYIFKIHIGSHALWAALVSFLLARWFLMFILAKKKHLY